MALDPLTCYAALVARDARFDGRFFVGVTSTGIYCRPVCVARTPGASRCRYFQRAAEAEGNGFRACLRCRPELAPGSASIDARSRLVANAMARIDAGALVEGSIEELAGELGIGSRQLRRAMKQELGLSPIAIAQSARLAIARQLTLDGTLPLTQVAFASGYSSLRRFNAAFRAQLDRTPSQLRRGRVSTRGGTLSISLGYREPFAWAELLRYLSARAFSCVEQIDGKEYLRTVRIGEHRGWIRVARHPDRPALRVELAHTLTRALMPIAGRLRHLFDLDADPQSILRSLRRDPLLAPQLRRSCPRLPGAFEGFEIAVRAILGQQVSVRAATTLTARLIERFGEHIETPWPALDRLFPSAAQLAKRSIAELAAIGIPRSRAAAILAISIAVRDRRLVLARGADPEATAAVLQSLPSIGPWTAQYVLMRALGVPDAFPDGDLGLRRAFGMISASALRARVQALRPWRAYAAISIWNLDQGAST